MLLDLLKDYKSGKISEQKTLQLIQEIKYNEYYSVIEDRVNFDKKRENLTGIPEIIFAQNKSNQDLKKIIFSLIKKRLLITKIKQSKFDFLQQEWLQYQKKNKVKKLPLRFPFSYNPKGEILFSPNKKILDKKVLILSGGTSDLPIVEETKSSLLFFGIKPTIYNDVGIASLKRVLHLIPIIQKATIIIITAGMEAALASVVAGLTKAPIIGIPTSVGYSGHFQGLSALLGMLGSCSPGIGIVNIDNGFGAAALTHKILQIKK